MGPKGAEVSLTLYSRTDYIVLGPQCGTSILSSQVLEARPVHGPVLFLLGPHNKGGCAFKVTDHLPIQGQLGPVGS